MKVQAVFILLCALQTIAEAQQMTFGAGFGFNIRNNSGFNIVNDSIAIEAEGSRSMINVYSLFAEYRINSAWQLRSSVNLTNQLNGFILYNYRDTCLFCDVRKATTVGSVNLNLTTEIGLWLPIRGPVEVQLIGGIRGNFNFTKDEPHISFRNGTRHQGLAEAINNLDKTIKPFYVNSVLGFDARWHRLSLIFLLDKNLGNSITRPLELYGERYTFVNRTNTFMLIANYRILVRTRK